MLAGPDGEFAAYALYSAILKKHGDIQPYAAIREAEARHIQALKRQLEKYGISIPEDKFAGKAVALATLLEAAKQGVDSEEKNIAMLKLMGARNGVIVGLILQQALLIGSEGVAQNAYWVKNPLKWDGGMLFFVGTFLGSLLSVLVSRTFRLEKVPATWSQQFRGSTLKRLVAAFLGGIIIMFTAIIVGGIGVLLLKTTSHAQYHIKPANMLGVSLGAALFGVGMVLYGYCPGTGVAAMATGSIHATVGFAGMLVGGVLYALSLLVTFPNLAAQLLQPTLRR